MQGQGQVIGFTQVHPKGAYPHQKEAGLLTIQQGNYKHGKGGNQNELSQCQIRRKDIEAMNYQFMNYSQKCVQLLSSFQSHKQFLPHCIISVSQSWEHLISSRKTSFFQRMEDKCACCYWAITVFQARESYKIFVECILDQIVRYIHKSKETDGQINRQEGASHTVESRKMFLIDVSPTFSEILQSRTWVSHTEGRQFTL